LCLKEDAKPIFCAPRRVPPAHLSTANTCIDRLVDLGVLEPTNYSEWGTPSVFVDKPDGSVRLCGDYRVTLNNQILDVRYPIPHIQDIFSKLEGGEYYCKLDLSDAYLHLPVDDQTAKLQALSTHRGTFLVKCLYFGVKSAPNIFHQFIDQVVCDLTSTVAYFDNIVVQCQTLEECEKRLQIILPCLQAYDLHINLKK